MKSVQNYSTVQMTDTQRQYRLAADWERHEATVIALPCHYHTRFSSLPSHAGGRFRCEEAYFRKLCEEVHHISNAVASSDSVWIMGTQGEISIFQGMPMRYPLPTMRPLVFTDPYYAGMNVDIRYESPLVVDEVLQETGHRTDRAIIMGRSGPGSANELRESSDRQAPTFFRDFLENIRHVSGEKHKFFAIAWDSSAFVHDGSGTFIVSKALIRMNTRDLTDPNLIMGSLECYMMQYMGAKRFVWVEQTPEETHRPLSSMIRFVRAGHILISTPPTFDGTFPYTKFFTAIYGALNSCKNAHDHKIFKITEIKEAPRLKAPAKIWKKTDRCGSTGWPLMSYLTYIHVSDGIVFPRFGESKADDAAELILKQVFKTKCPIIRGVEVRELPWWGSSLHSITQEVPLRLVQPHELVAVEVPQAQAAIEAPQEEDMGGQPRLQLRSEYEAGCELFRRNAVRVHKPVNITAQEGLEAVIERLSAEIDDSYSEDDGLSSEEEELDEEDEHADADSEECDETAERSVEYEDKFERSVQDWNTLDEASGRLSIQLTFGDDDGNVI